MRVNYKIDKNGRFQSITTFPVDEAEPTFDLPNDFDLVNMKDYVLKNGQLVHDPLPDPEPTGEQKIATLRQKIDATNSIVLDIAIGIANKDDYTDVLSERTKLQKELRELEKEA